METSLAKDRKTSRLRREAWTEEEDALLRRCMEKHGAVKWCDVPSKAGLNRCRKSCRLRWLNYLSPNIKRGRFEDDEEDLIMRLHKLLGNRWALIAGRLPGRTANDIKNHWNTHLSKRSITKEKPWNTKTRAKGSTREKPKEKKEEFKIIKPQPRTIPVNWSWLNDQSAVRQEHLKEKTGNIANMPSPSRNNINTPREESAIAIPEELDNAFLEVDDHMTAGEMQTNFVDGNIGGNTDEDFFLHDDDGGWASFLLDMDL